MTRMTTNLTETLRHPGRRALNAAGALVCAGLLGFAWYLQLWVGLDPCPLCLLQRWVFYVMTVVFVLAALFPGSHRSGWLWAGTTGLLGAAGAAIAGRHVWLQGLPPEQVPACGPDLHGMLENFGFGETLAMTLRGTGDCAVIDWSFLGLSIPGWALLWFVLLGLAGVLTNTLLPR